MSKMLTEPYTSVPAQDCVKSVLELSTCHVPLETEHWLCKLETDYGYEEERDFNDDNALLIVDKVEYGHLIWVPEDDEEDEAIVQLREKHIDLFHILVMAMRLKCRWVKFDCDACCIDGLPQYNW